MLPKQNSSPKQAFEQSQLKTGPVILVFLSTVLQNINISKTKKFKESSHSRKSYHKHLTSKMT